jgi:hypothetical protein
MSTRKDNKRSSKGGQKPRRRPEQSAAGTYAIGYGKPPRAHPSALNGHFTRQREAFYHAETLRVFVRDKVEPGTFERLQDEVFHGVVDASNKDHADGYERVLAVTKASQDMQLVANPIAPIAQTQDRHGICHQLANEDRLKWTK